MNRKRLRIRPFRILAAVLGVVTLVMLIRFPSKTVSMERQRKRLEDAAELYYEAQSRNNQLNTELAEINTRDFVERTARRNYGYCWYGETVYEVGNLDDFQREPEFEVYEQEETTEHEAG